MLDKFGTIILAIFLKIQINYLFNINLILFFKKRFEIYLFYIYLCI